MAQIFHSLKLAANASAENFHFERLAADPMPISAGRVWFNLTEKAFKFSSLDAGGAVVVKSFADAAAMAAAVADLQAAVTAEAATRAADDQTEIAARVAAIAALTQALTDETAARIAADTAEATARVDGIAVSAATASDSLATETAARLSGDAALGARVDGVQAELNTTQASVGLEVDGSYVAPLNTTYLGATTSLKTASVALDTALVAETAARTGAVASLASGLANEAQTRADADIALQTQLEAFVASAIGSNEIADQAEAAARIAADTAIKTELDLTQATIGTAPDGSLIPITGTNYLDAVTTVFGGAFVLDTEIKRVSDATAAETAARTTADATINAAIQSEATARLATDDAQQQELNRVEAGAGLETDGSYAAPTGSNYLNVSTSLKDADFILDAAVKAVADQASVIPSIQTALSTEVTRATGAEATETAARIASDEAINAAVTAETAARIASDEATNAAVAAEVTARTNADAGLQTQINAVIAAAGDGASALKTNLNAKRYTYQSSVPALEHTVTHNMNTLFFSMDIMVKDGQGVYVNDIMPVAIIDSNSFKVTLSAAADIIASGQSNAQLA